MKKISSTLIISVFFLFNVSAQVTFQKGYYINLKNDTINCLVKNVGWSKTPDYFSVKDLDNQNNRNLSINDINVLKIQDQIKFVNTFVQEDVSDNNNKNIALEKEIEYTKEISFLKVLLESNYSLYVRKKGTSQKYFYSGPDGIIYQLVNKSFYTEDNNVSKSREYLYQLLRINVCESEDLQNFVINMSLTESDLIRYFSEINKCINSDIQIYQENASDLKSSFHLSLKMGAAIGASQYSVIYTNRTEKVDFPNTTSIVLGFEFEKQLKMNKYKWSLIFEPTYKFIQSSITKTDQRLERKYEVNVHSLDIPIGIRYKMYLSKDSYLFLTAQPQYTFVLGNSFVNLDFGQNYEADIRLNTAFGGGFKYKKFMIEYKRGRPDFMWQRVFQSLKNTQNIILIGYTFQ